MKKISLFMIVATAIMVAFTSCNNNESGGSILVEDGIYLIGAATPWNDLADAARLTITPNERKSDDGGDAAAEIFEIYAPLSAGNFNISIVTGGKETLNGGTLTDTYEGAEDPGDLPMEPAYYYNLATGGNFSVSEAGMYHIIYYKNANKVAITKVIWGIRGAMNGWSFTAATSSADFKTWTLTGVEATSNGTIWKFAHSGGWKLGLDNLDDAVATVRVNLNFGGSLTIGSEVGASASPTLVPGGENYEFDKGIYTLVLTWANGAWSATVTKTANSDAPDYPENLYVVGDGTLAGWTPANGATLHPVEQTLGMFYGVVWLNETGGFKFCIQRDWGGDFGSAGETVEDHSNIAQGGSNIPVPGTAGYYVIVVDMANKLISVIEPEIYATGEAYGSWGEANSANLFTVNNTVDPADATMTSPAATADGKFFRAFIKHAWISDWWKSEVAPDGEGGIVFKNNPPDVTLTAGQKVVFNFNAGTTTIE